MPLFCCTYFMAQTESAGLENDIRLKSCQPALAQYQVMDIKFRAFNVKLFPLHILYGDGFSPTERMLPVDQQFDLVLFHKCSPCVFQQAVSHCKGHISLSLLEQPFHLAVRIFPVIEFNMGILFLKIHQAFRSHKPQYAVGGQQVDLMVLPLFNAADLAAYGVVRIQKFREPGIQISACFRETDSVPVLFKERRPSHSQYFFMILLRP